MWLSLDRQIQIGAATCSEGFVKCCLRVPHYDYYFLSQHGSCSIAGRPVKLSENILQNLRNKLPPKTVVIDLEDKERLVGMLNWYKMKDF